MSDGESIMVAQQYIVAAKLIIKLLDSEKHATDIEFFNAKIKDFSAALDERAWDGKWYKRLLFPNYAMGAESC
jgi:cellobiose phosphorylase